MKNKGFTVVELLAVIIILSVIIAFAFPAIFNTSSKATCWTTNFKYFFKYTF